MLRICPKGTLILLTYIAKANPSAKEPKNKDKALISAFDFSVKRPKKTCQTLIFVGVANFCSNRGTLSIF
jgi:hypothetical protein